MSSALKKYPALKNIVRTAAVLTIGLASLGGFAQSEEADTKISLSWFRKNICEKKITTIEQALSILPESYRENYTLMSKSPSLQLSTPKFPRAILFGSDASFILTFTGSNVLRGHDSLEVSQFNFRTSEFEFREIKFPTVENKLTQPYITKANPAVCLACHGSSPRPNWDQYSIWPNAYGVDDDALKDVEAEQYLKFAKTSKSHPRYKWLVRDDSKPVFPFHMGGKIPDLSLRPNLRLTILLARLNALKLASRISHYPRFLQQIIAYLGSRCDYDPQNPHTDLNRTLTSVIESVTGNTLAPEDNIIYYRLLNHLGLTAQLYTTAPYTTSERIPSYRFSTGDDYGIDMDNYLVGAIFENWKKEGLTKYENTFFRYFMSEEKYFENSIFNQNFLNSLDKILTPAKFYSELKFATLCEVLGSEILSNSDKIESTISKNKSTFDISGLNTNKLEKNEMEPLCQ